MDQEISSAAPAPSQQEMEMAWRRRTEKPQTHLGMRVRQATLYVETLA